MVLWCYDVCWYTRLCTLVLIEGRNTYVYWGMSLLGQPLLMDTVENLVYSKTAWIKYVLIHDQGTIC